MRRSKKMLGGTEAGEEVNEDGKEVREPHVGTPL